MTDLATGSSWAADPTAEAPPEWSGWVGGGGKQQ